MKQIYYEELTVPELKELAAESGIDIPRDARKAEIIEALEAGSKAQSKEQSPGGKESLESADSDIEVSGAGSPGCNGRYAHQDADHWKGPAGVFHLARITGYPSPGVPAWAILQDENIYYTAPDTPLPWESVWAVGSFGADPAPQVQTAQQPGNNISQFQMTSTETKVLSHDDFWKIKLTV